MDKWIKFSEKMPVERETAFAKFYGTDKWRKGMFRTACFDLLITVEHNRERFVEHGWTIDGVPGTDYMRINKDAVAIAWIQYPEPYKEISITERDALTLEEAREIMAECFVTNVPVLQIAKRIAIEVMDEKIERNNQRHKTEGTELLIPGEFEQCKTCENNETAGDGFYCMITSGVEFENGKCSDYKELSMDMIKENKK